MAQGGAQFIPARSSRHHHAQQDEGPDHTVRENQQRRDVLDLAEIEGHEAPPEVGGQGVGEAEVGVAAGWVDGAGVFHDGGTVGGR